MCERKKTKVEYIEDRRPNANIDPYMAILSMLESLNLFYAKRELK